jgi:hypothetical protein
VVDVGRAVGEDAGIRLFLLGAAVLALTVTTAASAGADPRAMVLRTSDLPHGYAILRANTGPAPNAKAAQGNRDLLARFATWGRVTGYRVEFTGGVKGSIGSSADLFRGTPGARGYLRWSAQVTPPRTGLRLVRRQRGPGDEAYVFEKDFGTTLFVVVEWRYRNVTAHVGADGVGVSGALALARVQQRRIVAALR